MTDPEEDGSSSRRRVALLLLAAIVVLLGAGIGTMTIFGPDGSEETPAGGPSVTPTPTLTDGFTVTTTDSTPTTVQAGTPTATSPGTTPTGTPRETATVTDTSTPTPTRTPSVTSTATPTRTQTGSAGGGQGGGGTSDDEATVSLDAPDDATLLQTQGVVPGQSGVETVALTNGGQRAGRIRLATVTVVDHENGIVGPEAPVDDSPNEGELSDAVEIKLSFEYPDGSRVYVAGSASSYVSLSSLSGSAAPDKTVNPGQHVTVTLDWRIDRSAGNEIQSDGTTFDAVFELRAPEP